MGSRVMAPWAEAAAVFAAAGAAHAKAQAAAVPAVTEVAVTEVVVTEVAVTGVAVTWMEPAADWAATAVDVIVTLATRMAGSSLTPAATAPAAACLCEAQAPTAVQLSCLVRGVLGPRRPVLF
mmetsp:Transcript_4923/g.16242  ORF Transcript_4923/g.16242 Transcript_4923/m.16242 type:complete len:123 (+) Transcript_4923:450-818(+)